MIKKTVGIVLWCILKSLVQVHQIIISRGIKREMSKMFKGANKGTSKVLVNDIVGAMREHMIASRFEWLRLRGISRYLFGRMSNERR